MIDLENLSRRWGLACDGNALVCGLARITPLDGSDGLVVNTSDSATAKALLRARTGHVLYGGRRDGPLSLEFRPRDLGAIVEALAARRS